MQVSYFETGRYYAPSNLPREWPMPPGTADREAGLCAFHGHGRAQPVNQHRTGTPLAIEGTFLIPCQESAFWWGPRRRRSGPPVQWIPDIVSRS